MLDFGFHKQTFLTTSVLEVNSKGTFFSVAREALLLVFLLIFFGFIYGTSPTPRLWSLAKKHQPRSTIPFCVVQYDTDFSVDDITSKWSLLMPYTKKACEEYPGCFYISGNRKLPFPPFWAKVYFVFMQMKIHSMCNSFIFLDVDAYISDFDYMKNLVAGEADMIITNEISDWHGDFNAAVFVMKNTPMGHEIMQKWMDTYFRMQSWAVNTEKYKGNTVKDKFWQYEFSRQNGGSWTTKSNWGGTFFEQGTFMDFILSNKTYKDHIQSVDWKILNNPTDKCDGPKVHHFVQGYSRNIPSFLHYCVLGIPSDDLPDVQSDQLVNLRLLPRKVMGPFS